MNHSVRNVGHSFKTAAGFVGHTCSTKCVSQSDFKYLRNFNARVIMTGSEEERNAVKYAFQFSSRTEHEIYQYQSEDVEFRLDVRNTVYMGNSFDVAVVVENKSENTRNIKVNFTAVLSHYTDVPAKKLKTYKLQFLLNSKAGKFSRIVEVRKDVKDVKIIYNCGTKFNPQFNRSDAWKYF